MADKHPANQPEETTVLYQNIKAICDEQRKSISQLERDSGIPAKTIANWKANRSWMIALIRVADTLEISLDKLFDRQSISCLLYTSPSPRDRQKSRMPSSA